MTQDDIATELYDRFTIATFTIHCDGCEKDVDIQATDKEDAVDIFMTDLGGSWKNHIVSCSGCPKTSTRS